MKLDQDEMQLHINMLNDRTRTSGFINAINEVVRPGDIVVDIGTGTGILAIAAIRAGAQHVYAIESGRRISDIARAIFKDNGLEDRITLIQGNSTEVELPKHANVLISEVIGHDPLAEGVVATMADAVKRFLEPRARLIPSKLRIFCLPVSIPQSELKTLVFTPTATRNWRKWYDIEFAPLLDVNRDVLFRFFINPYFLRNWKPLTPAILLADINFKTCDISQIDVTRIVKATDDGQMSGLIFYFELVLNRNNILSSHPTLVKRHHHWDSPVWVSIDPISLRSGARFSINYKYDLAKEKSWCEINLID